MQAGDVLPFHDLLLHSSHLSASGESRFRDSHLPRRQHRGQLRRLPAGGRQCATRWLRRRPLRTNKRRPVLPTVQRIFELFLEPRCSAISLFHGACNPFKRER